MESYQLQPSQNPLQQGLHTSAAFGITLVPTCAFPITVEDEALHTVAHVSLLFPIVTGEIYTSSKNDKSAAITHGLVWTFDCSIMLCLDKHMNGMRALPGYVFIDLGSTFLCKRHHRHTPCAHSTQKVGRLHRHFRSA